MPHRDFALAKARTLQEQITFTFGGESFTVAERPSLGDTFDLMEVPDPTPTNMAQAAFQLAQFIRRMLIPDDRERWEKVLHEIPQTQVVDVIELGTWLAEEVTGRPFSQPATSSGGPRRTGQSSKRSTAGRTASKRSRRT